MKSISSTLSLLLLQPVAHSAGDLSFVNLPAGFNISIYADNVENARSMALSESGVLFVGTRNKGSVYALIDNDADGFAETKYTIAENLNMPNGVALNDGDLYVAEVNRIIKFTDIESQLANNLDFEVIFSDYPSERHHGWKFIAFGPDEKLYVPVGAPCNICESEDDIFASLTRMNKDGSEFEIIHKGIRNSVGFNWHPVTNSLWFTDNGGDRLGDDIPADELNVVTAENQHFGFPYCHQGDVSDPNFGSKFDCDEFTPPAQKLGPHVAALGMEFYQQGQFPESFQNNVFLAEHGSWNRSVPIGYRIMKVDIDGNNASNYSVFIDGFRDNENDITYGRPVDLEWMADGSLLISDDYANLIYRVSYQ